MLCFDNRQQQLPLTRYSVLNNNRRPVGYLNVPAIKRKFESGQAGETDIICELKVFWEGV